MASPSAAGAGTLIRQYFIDNNSQFWRAICNAGYPSCRSFIPSGSFIKAILVHGGINMTMFAGGGSKNVQLGSSPDYTQGFGRIGLMNVLPLKGIISGSDLFVADSANIKENSQIVGPITVSNSNVPLRQAPLS
jgi:hypothetical protein